MNESLSAFETEAQIGDAQELARVVGAYYIQLIHEGVAFNHALPLVAQFQAWHMGPILLDSFLDEGEEDE